MPSPRKQAPLRCLDSPVRTLDTSIAQVPKKTADPFYLSTAWRQLVTTLIRKRGRRCEQCGRENTRIFGDHVQELKDGGAPLAASNVRLLCGSCHTRKTARARADRVATRYATNA